LYHFQYRNYDAQLGRWHNVDAFADKYNSFSPYHFSGNNPVMNKEQDGRFFWSVVTAVVDFVATGFFKGGFDPTSASARSSAWKEFDPTARWSKTNKAWEIDKGLVQTDPNRSWFGQALQLISRFTWEAPQTFLGHLTGHLRNITEVGGYVDYVGYYGGATVISSGGLTRFGESRGAFTLGSFINGTQIRAEATDELFRHEYGHTLQSQFMGPFYLTKVGLPSLIGSGLQGIDRAVFDHDAEWYEAWANDLGRNYFEHHEAPSMLRVPWNNREYPTGFNSQNASHWYSLFASFFLF
jgi:hypothetical protein